MVAEMSASGSPMPVKSGPNWRTRLQAWRARQVARSGFRKFVQRLPLSRSYARTQEADLFSLVTGFVQSQILFTTVETGLLGALEAGPATVADLVRATGLSEDRLRRLLQAALAVKLVSIGDDGFVTGESYASAAAAVNVTAFNQSIVMGANVLGNAVDMTVVGGSLSSSVVGDDDLT